MVPERFPLVGTLNLEKALAVGAFSVIVKTDGSYGDMLGEAQTTSVHRTLFVFRMISYSYCHNPRVFYTIPLICYSTTACT